MDTKGQLVITDVWFVEMPTETALKALISWALKTSKMKVVGEIDHVFGENAFTYAALLAESHFAIHTYPERLYAAMDIYACGDEGDPLIATQAVLSGCQIRSSKIQIISRG